MNPIEELIAGFQNLVGQVPEILQPVIVALAGAIPFIEGEGGAAIGVIGGVNPIVAAIAAALGNFVAVVLVVLLGSRIRTAAVDRRASRKAAVAASVSVGSGAGAGAPSSAGTVASGLDDEKPESKGRTKLRRWLVRFGVPGASLLAPLALPTHFTAATLVASGIDKSRVLFWQAIAIVLWTTLVTVSASIALRVVTS
jgi:hypothetical protein